ncbi:MAG: phenylalanine--tRNA ligase subunit beta [Gemmatales bacterium]|nr:phenylalanine--tRNA ligase subunit beta [Gemmatales bacterium]MDW7993981.1 phenylalanine--tRNA ligase subunit beta [Gemmatales bacterium]
MKVPLRWLKEYVDLPWSVAELAERLTLAGLEVTGFRAVGVPPPTGLRLKSEFVSPVWDEEKVVIAEVLEVRKHPDADRLHLVDLNYGTGCLTVVTGATNLKPGDRGLKVVLARVGAVLIDGHSPERALRPLKPAKIRGVLSEGMVCSALELGIADEHEGILILDPDAPVGMPLAEYLGDIVLELDVLPSMARCLSMLGVAREVAALSEQPVRYPPTEVLFGPQEAATQVHISIEDANLCSRYAAMVIDSVRVAPSPTWLQLRLLLAGMRPINNIVDITNYVLLEWGQPLHAFDYEKLRDRAHGHVPHIIVRRARPGESLTTLDGQQRPLHGEHLVIADTAGPIALAGVMGGLETEVGPETQKVLLESANFDPVTIRRTARHFDLPSEASLRFSRGVHPDLVEPAARRAVEWMRQLAQGTVARGLVDVYAARPSEQRVHLSLAYVHRMVGYAIPRDDILRILRGLEFTVDEAGEDTWLVTVPRHRLDVQHGPADLVEEIVRIYGYHRIPPTLPREPLPDYQTPRDGQIEERIRDILVTLGCQEVITYSLTSIERERPFVGEGADYVRLLNPIHPERSVLRRSLLASVLAIAAQHLRDSPRLRLFELGYVYLPRAGEKFPDERRHLALVLCGPRLAEFWEGASSPPQDFFDLKGLLEGLFEALHLGQASQGNARVAWQPTNVTWLHPRRAAALVLRPLQSHTTTKGIASSSSDTSLLIGYAGQLHPQLHDTYELGRREVYVAQLDLEALWPHLPERFTCRAVASFPPVRQDLAVLVDESIVAERVREEIFAAGRPLLREVHLFDVYRGPNIPEGKKSLAWSLTFQAEDRTLTDKEISKLVQKIVDRLEKSLAAQLRAP